MKLQENVIGKNIIVYLFKPYLSIIKWDNTAKDDVRYEMALHIYSKHLSWWRNSDFVDSLTLGRLKLLNVNVQSTNLNPSNQKEH